MAKNRSQIARDGRGTAESQDCDVGSKRVLVPTAMQTVQRIVLVQATIGEI
jgi:hypothetical protein